MAVLWGKTITTLDGAAAAADAGFDVAEPALGLLADLSDTEFPERSKKLRATGLRFDVFSSILPHAVRVTEPGFNIYVWSEYLKRALERIEELGCRFIVWSNGRARLLPEEGGAAAEKRQVLQFLFMVSELAEAHGITVLVEPLDPRRTNFLNSMAEMKGFLDLAGRPNLSSAVSLRDMESIAFGPDGFAVYRDLISHVYMENPHSPVGARTAPRPNDGRNYQPFLSMLHDIGYSGIITLPEDADAAALDYCRGLTRT